MKKIKKSKAADGSKKTLKISRPGWERAAFFGAIGALVFILVFWVYSSYNSSQKKELEDKIRDLERVETNTPPPPMPEINITLPAPSSPVTPVVGGGTTATESYKDIMKRRLMEKIIENI